MKFRYEFHEKEFHGTSVAFQVVAWKWADLSQEKGIIPIVYAMHYMLNFRCRPLNPHITFLDSFSSDRRYTAKIIEEFKKAMIEEFGEHEMFHVEHQRHTNHDPSRVKITVPREWVLDKNVLVAKHFLVGDGKLV
jgi:hypothetical protein